MSSFYTDGYQAALAGEKCPIGPVLHCIKDHRITSDICTQERAEGYADALRDMNLRKVELDLAL